MPSNHPILCYPLLLLPSIFPSFRVFANESVLHIKWPKYWSFSFSISPSTENSGLIPFRIDYFYLLEVRGAVKRHLQQFKSINYSALSLLCGPTLTPICDYWINHSFDYMDIYQQIMSLLFNMLSRFAIAFLPRSKHLLISWLQSQYAVILKPKKMKSNHSFCWFPIYLP